VKALNSFLCSCIEENVCNMEVQDGDCFISTNLIPFQKVTNHHNLSVVLSWTTIYLHFHLQISSHRTLNHPAHTSMCVLCVCVHTHTHTHTRTHTHIQTHVEEQKMCCLLSITKWIICILTDFPPPSSKPNLQIHRYILVYHLIDIAVVWRTKVHIHLNNIDELKYLESSLINTCHWTEHNCKYQKLLKRTYCVSLHYFIIKYNLDIRLLHLGDTPILCSFLVVPFKA
jgi:hypothetical protein